MKITTAPNSRFGWEGQTLHYVVNAEGATELKVPEAKKGLEITVSDARSTGHGVEAQVDVAVTSPEFY
jgi:hypothetical protein